jgi:hypothetical protein
VDNTAELQRADSIAAANAAVSARARSRPIGRDD